MRVYRFFSQLHEHPRLIEFASTPAGRILVWLAATLLLLPKRPVALLVSPILALLLLFPERRKGILVLGSFVAYFKIASDSGLSEPIPLLIGLVLVLVFSYGLFLLAARYRRLPSVVQRFPLAFTHLPILLFIAFLWWQRSGVEVFDLDSRLAACLSLMSFLMWRWTYLLFSGRRGHVSGTGFFDHIFYLLPSFGGTNVPFGKGYESLSSREPRDRLENSRSQLAGLKLLVLVILWRIVKRAVGAVAYGTPNSRISNLLGGWDLGLVPLATQLAGEMPGDVSVLAGWAMLLAALFQSVLSLAIFGHLIIGCLRLFGFNVFRNTYKPLLAESLVEYWNRFYYYFKELLVEFFFYPTFLACARLPATMRIFVSIMAAAFLGNFYYHFVRDMELYLEASGDDVVAMLLPWIFYAVTLGMGIFVSMLRERKRRRHRHPDRSTAARLLVSLRRILGVWIFYGFLLIWISGPPTITFGKRFEFLQALLAIH